MNKALERADQIHRSEEENDVETDWFVPIVADGEAGFGGTLNVFEPTKQMIEAGSCSSSF